MTIMNANISVGALNSNGEIDAHVQHDPYNYALKTTLFATGVTSSLFVPEGGSGLGTFTIEVATATGVPYQSNWITAQEWVYGENAGIFSGWYALPEDAQASDWNDPDKYTFRMEGFHRTITMPEIIGCTDKHFLKSIVGTSIAFNLVAKYDPAYQIVLNANGGYFGNTTNTKNTALLRKGEPLKNMQYEPRYFTDSPLSTGYTFAGWSTDGTINGLLSGSFVPTADTRLYACWAHVMTFDANGGTVDVQTRFTQALVPLGTLPTPVRDGYIFDGWSNGLTTFTETSLPLIKDFTVYAQWKRRIDIDDVVPPSSNEPESGGGGTRRYSSTMSTSGKITIKPLPHRLASADIGDAKLKHVAMLFMEDISFLKAQLETAQRAIIELQKKGG